ncbi:hypothetical protein HK102_008706, partial [Quaeritorhiza haematococci]
FGVFRDSSHNVNFRAQLQKFSEIAKWLLYSIRIIGSAIHIILFSLAAFYHAREHFGPQVIVFTLGLVCIGLNYAVIAYITNWIWQKLIGMLRGQANVDRQSPLAFKVVSPDLEQLANKVRLKPGLNSLPPLRVK